MKTAEQTVNDSAAQTSGRVPEAPASVFAWLQLFTPMNLAVMLLLLVVIISALAVVNASFESRTVFHELQQLRAESNALEVEWGQLLIEQSTFGLEGRIEKIAMDELEMKLPDWSRIIMVRYE